MVIFSAGPRRRAKMFGKTYQRFIISDYRTTATCCHGLIAIKRKNGGADRVEKDL